MGRPLLTDEMIERANRGEDIRGPRLYDEEETKIIGVEPQAFGYAQPQESSQSASGFSQETFEIQVEPTIYKSRRIENEKRGVFRAKLNKILFIVLLLFVALLIAMWKL